MDDRLFELHRADRNTTAVAGENGPEPTAAYGRCHVTGCLCTMFTGGWTTCQTSGCGHHFDSHG
jgi:hypothetical protein